MDRLQHFRSLRAYAITGILGPLTLVIIGLIITGLISYQHLVSSLLIDQHKQLASLSALGISEVVEGYANILMLLADNEDLTGSAPEARERALKKAADVLEIFNAGVMVVNENGEMLSISEGHTPPVSANIAEQDFFIQVKNERKPVYSSALVNERDGFDMVIIAVPVLAGQGEFNGALLGAVHLQTSTLSEPVKRLVASQEAFAYIVDGRGRVIFHPHAGLIGSDLSSLAHVQAVISGQSGSVRWSEPRGESIVEAYVPIGSTNWGLIVREPWNSIIAPVGTYRTIILAAGTAAVLLMVLVSMLSLRGFVTPIRRLVNQTTQLANGDLVEPGLVSQIEELNTLERAFQQMAGQIASYRAGLRRYLGAITQSQEDERRRIARELHDETVQNLLAVTRRLELFQSSEEDAARRESLAGIQQVVNQTLDGIRQISRDLRPLMLEDLGLVPAIRALVSEARQGVGAIPHARFDVSGQALKLSSDQEVALYRITQEALNNVRKHASPTGVGVKLEWNPAMLCLEVVDDGIGFTPPASLAELAQHGCYGLMGIQERVWGVGGTLKITSSPGEGTQLFISIPLKIKEPQTSDPGLQRP